MADIAKKRKYSKSDAGQKRPSAAFAEDQQGDRRHDHQQQREDYPDPQFHYIRPSPGFGSPKRYPAETSFKPYTGSVGGGSGGGGHQKGRSSSPRPFYNGFYFRPRRERLNWRSLASVSVDRVVRDVDVELLQEVLENITYCDIEAEDLRYVDPNIVKLFQLSQLLIEYLLHSQEYLIVNRQQVLDDIANLRKRHSDLMEEHDKVMAEFTSAKKENKGFKKTLYAYQLVSKLPNGFGNNGAPVAFASYHRCMNCPKVFSSKYFLDSHIQRRHPEVHHPINQYHPNPAAAAYHHHSMISNEGDIYPDYSRKAAATAQPVPPPQKQSSQPDMVEKIGEMIEKFSEKMAETERQLRTEMDDKLNRQIAERQSVLENLYKQEQLRYEKEIQELKTSIHRELTEEKNHLQEHEKKIERMINAKSAVPVSNVGKLEDDSSSSALPSMDSIDEADWVADRGIKPQIPNQGKALAAFTELDVESEKRTQQSLETFKSQMQKEMEEMKKVLLEEQAKERRVFEEKLVQANEQLKLIHQTMLEGDKETEESEEEEEVEEEEEEETDETQEELRKRNSIIRRQTEEMSARERQAKESELSTKAEIELLKKQLELEKQREEYNREQMEKEMAEKMKHALAARPRESPRVSVHERPFTWDYAMELLSKHSFSLVPGATWLKSLFNHPLPALSSQKKGLEQFAEKRMSVFHLDQSDFIEHWKDDKIRPQLEREYNEAVVAFNVEIGRKVRDNPMYEKMHTYFEEQLEMIAAKSHSPKIIPPPIITNLLSSIQAAHATSALPHSITSSAPTSPSKKVAEEKTKLERKNSFVANFSRRWRFPSMRRGNRSSSPGSTAGSVNWDESGTDYTGSDAGSIQSSPKRLDNDSDASRATSPDRQSDSDASRSSSPRRGNFVSRILFRRSQDGGSRSPSPTQKAADSPSKKSAPPTDNLSDISETDEPRKSSTARDATKTAAGAADSTSSSPVKKQGFFARFSPKRSAIPPPPSDAKSAPSTAENKSSSKENVVSEARNSTGSKSDKARLFETKRKTSKEDLLAKTKSSSSKENIAAATSRGSAPQPFSSTTKSTSKDDLLNKAKSNSRENLIKQKSSSSIDQRQPHQQPTPLQQQQLAERRSKDSLVKSPLSSTITTTTGSSNTTTTTFHRQQQQPSPAAVVATKTTTSSSPQPIAQVAVAASSSAAPKIGKLDFEKDRHRSNNEDDDDSDEDSGHSLMPPPPQRPSASLPPSRLLNENSLNASTVSSLQRKLSNIQQQQDFADNKTTRLSATARTSTTAKPIPITTAPQPVAVNKASVRKPIESDEDEEEDEDEGEEMEDLEEEEEEEEVEDEEEESFEISELSDSLNKSKRQEDIIEEEEGNDDDEEEDDDDDEEEEEEEEEEDETSNWDDESSAAAKPPVTIAKAGSGPIQVKPAAISNSKKTSGGKGGVDEDEISSVSDILDDLGSGLSDTTNSQTSNGKPPVRTQAFASPTLGAASKSLPVQASSRPQQQRGGHQDDEEEEEDLDDDFDFDDSSIDVENL